MTTNQKASLTSDRTPKSQDFGNPTTRAAGLLSKTAIKFAAILLVLAALIAGGMYAHTRVTATQTSTEETTLQTAKATLGDLVLYAHGTGTIMPAEESSFGFNTSGQVSEIYVKIGDPVEAGDVLAQLDDTDAQIQLAEAQEAMKALTSASALAVAKQTLAEALESFDLARESLQFLVSLEVLYWEEKVTEREQTLADAQGAYQTDTSDEAKQKVTEAGTSLEYAQAQLKYFQTVYEETYVIKNFTQYQTRMGTRRNNNFGHPGLG